jgi:hypothetical protein
MPITKTICKETRTKITQLLLESLSRREVKSSKIALLQAMKNYRKALKIKTGWVRKRIRQRNKRN